MEPIILTTLLFKVFLLVDTSELTHANVEKRECGVFRNRGNLKFIGNVTCSDNSTCPPWFQCRNNECKCGPNHLRTICCDDEFQQSAVLDCHCMTHDENTGETVAGACFYNCANSKDESIDTVYNVLPPNVSDLNRRMCGPLNRKGPLCGECVNGTYPLAYSFNLSCVQCPDSHKNWWKYIFVAFIPLTVFCFIVLFFKISATTSHLHGFVLYSQVVSAPIYVRIALRSTESNLVTLASVKVLVFFYGIWNLDFFRTLIPGICLQTTTLQTLALDYVIAVYPLFLMIISYILIELHDRNFRVIVFLWKPLRFIFTFFRRNWDSRTSVIDAYATFFLLSFIKFLGVSFDLLIPTHLFSLNSNKTTLVLYYDGSIEYFGKEHLPYGVLAIAILIFFVVLPVLILLLYPFKPFQKFLSCSPVRWHILSTFVDSFQGCYKDGTEPGTHDCRWFAPLFLILRIWSGMLYAFMQGSIVFEAEILTYLLFALLLQSVQPFKGSVAHHTRINVFFILLLCIFFTGMAGMNIASIKAKNFFTFYLIMTSISGISPLVYMACVVIHWFFTRRKWGMAVMERIRAWRQGYNQLEPDGNFEESLPDRVVNPGEYHEGNLSSFDSLRIDMQSVVEVSSQTAY